MTLIKNNGGYGIKTRNQKFSTAEILYIVY